MRVGYPDFTLPVDITRATYFALTLARMIEGGVRVLRQVYLYQSYATIYTVPPGKRAYIVSILFKVYNSGIAFSDSYVLVKRGIVPVAYLIYEHVQGGATITRDLTGLVTRLEEGESIEVSAGYASFVDACFSIIETP
jgi:hypothetical protein